jgi:glutathione S-transferase
LGCEYEHKIIDLTDKPDEFCAKYALAENKSGSPKVPLLEHAGTLVTESIEVCKYIGQHVDRHDNKLYPQSERERIDQFINSWDNDVTRSYYAYLSARGKAEVQSARTKFVSSLQTLDKYFQGSGPYLLGNSFSIGECISAPWIQRFHHVIPHFRAETMDDIEAPDSVVKWMNSVQKRQSVVDTGVPPKEMFRAAEKYYVSYISPGAPLSSTRTSTCTSGE